MEKDGNPIWDARSERLDRAVRIIQDPPIEHGFELAAWVKSYEEEFTELPRSELIISISLSEESARLAEKLLRKWMTPETTVEEMKAFIEEHAPERRSSNHGE